MRQEADACKKEDFGNDHLEGTKTEARGALTHTLNTS